MGMYERYVNKKVKIVWSDFDRQKAIVGLLEEHSNGFLTIKTSKGNNLISILETAVLTISEYFEGGR